MTLEKDCFMAEIAPGNARIGRLPGPSFWLSFKGPPLGEILYLSPPRALVEILSFLAKALENSGRNPEEYLIVNLVSPDILGLDGSER